MTGAGAAPRGSGGEGRAERNRRLGGPTPLGSYVADGAGHVLAAGETMAYRGCGCAHDLHDTRPEFQSWPIVRCACGDIAAGRRCGHCALVY